MFILSLFLKFSGWSHFRVFSEKTNMEIETESQRLERLSTINVRISGRIEEEKSWRYEATVGGRDVAEVSVQFLENHYVLQKNILPGRAFKECFGVEHNHLVANKRAFWALQKTIEEYVRNNFADFPKERGPRIKYHLRK